MLPSTLELKHGTWWTLNTRLSSWADFQTPGVAVSSVDVSFAPEGRGPEPLSPAELTLLEWFFEHESEVSAAVQHALLAAYPEIQAMFRGEGEEDLEELPEISSIDGLKNRVCLHTVHVHQVRHGGLPYLGFELAYTWDEEHGLGVLMHGTRPVEVGGADTASLLWLAEQDAQRQAGQGARQ